MMATQTRVAEIALEAKSDWDVSMPVAGRGYSLADAPLLVQPAGVRLDNDGCFTHWLEPDSSWTLHHDGTGWRAQCKDHSYSLAHAMRLADANGPKDSFVGRLPLAAGGEFELIEGVTYVLRIGANKELTKSVLILSIL